MNKELEKKVDLKITWSDFEICYQRELQKYRSGVKLDGFRKGKVPVEIIRSSYHGTIINKAIDAVINKQWRDYLTQKPDLKLADAPRYEPEFNEEKKQLRCAITFETLPIIPPIDLKKETFDNYQSEINDDDIGRMTAKILKEKNTEGKKSEEEIIQELGFKKEPKKEFHDYIKRSLQQELKNRLFQKNKHGIFARLLEKYKFPVPQSLIDRSIKDQEKNEENIKKAQMGAKHELLFNHLVESFKITPKQEEVESLFTYAALSTQNPEQSMKDMSKSPQWRNYFFSMACEKALIDHILMYAETKEVKMKSEELISYE